MDSKLTVCILTGIRKSEKESFDATPTEGAFVM